MYGVHACMHVRIHERMRDVCMSEYTYAQRVHMYMYIHTYVFIWTHIEHTYEYEHKDMHP